jgi:hypothetical protein
MPHVQVVCDCRPRDLLAPLANLTAGEPPLVLRVRDTFLNGAGDHLLLEALVVEGYLRQAFFLLLREDADGVLIRCHPFSAVQKTTGVKKLIAEVARRCLQHCPGGRIGHTNLQAYLQ